MNRDVIRLALPGSFFTMVGLGHLFFEGDNQVICQSNNGLPNSCICLDNSTIDAKDEFESLHQAESA